MDPFTERLISWVLIIFFGGFLIYSIQDFVKRTKELAPLFQELKMAVMELRSSITNQNRRATERERTVNAHLEKHDRYIKSLFEKVNTHDTEIQLLKKDAEFWFTKKDDNGDKH